MNRSGRPFAAAMCQPSLLPNAAGADPPAFVAMPLRKIACDRAEHGPQKPTYDVSP